MLKTQLLWMLVNAALKYLNGERMRKWIHMGIHEIKDAIREDGVTDWKDKVVLPMLDNIEIAFGLDEDPDIAVARQDPTDQKM